MSTRVTSTTSSTPKKTKAEKLRERDAVKVIAITHPCGICGKVQNRPMAFLGEPYCSIVCGKAMGLIP